MQDSDLENFAAMMTAVAEATGGDITALGIDIYFRVLTDYSFPQVRQAADKVVRRWGYTKMPPVAEFLRELGDTTADHKATARIEAAKVIDLCGDPVGNYPKLDDPVTRAVLNMRFGGLRGVGAMPVDKLGFFERDFIELYLAYAGRGVQDLGRAALASPHAKPLAGRRGPVRIGDALGGALLVATEEVQ